MLSFVISLHCLTTAARRLNSRGMVLASSLMILTVLLAVGIGIRVMLQNDYRILANLRSSTQAFYHSIAGIEWSKNEIAASTAFPPAPANQTKSFSTGGFAVTFLSPAATGPLTARIIARSVGTAVNAAHLSEVQLTKSYDLADAAIAVRGNPARVSLSGTELLVSGADHDPANGKLISEAKARPAISTNNELVRDLVAQGLSNPTVLDGASAAPALAQSDFLSSAFLTQLADNLCAAPDAVLHTIPEAASLTVENQVWGSQSSPVIHCIDGSSASPDAATITGNVSGVGILIVRNADLVLSGSLRWEGLVVVTGQEVSLKATGPSSKEILGATVVNETGAPGSGTAILDLQGSFRVLFSRQALRRVAQLIPMPTLAITYSALPSLVAQDYWRNSLP